MGQKGFKCLKDKCLKLINLGGDMGKCWMESDRHLNPSYLPLNFHSDKGFEFDI